jgi:hypothetical protein
MEKTYGRFSGAAMTAAERGYTMSEREELQYLEDNIATVAFHLGQPGAVLRVDHEKGGLNVEPGEVLKEISRRLSGVAPAPETERLMQWIASLLNQIAKLETAALAQAPTEPHETTYLRGWNEGIEHALEVVGNMRQSEAGLFDAKHSGQRGCDRSDALYDAYVAVKASIVSSTVREDLTADEFRSILAAPSTPRETPDGSQS